MVIGAFPAAKLGALLLRQISKPIANYIKEQAKKSPVFRTYVCMPPAQIYNWCEVKTKMWILNLGKPVNIPVLNEAMAIELGANLLGEGIIFVIAAGVLVSEYNRSARKEAAKEADKADEMQTINNELQELFFQMEEQRVQIKELLRIVVELDSRGPTKFFSDRHNGDEEPPGEAPPPLPALEVLEAETRPPPKAEETPKSLLLKAVGLVERDFLVDTRPDRHNLGVLNMALDYLHKDLCRIGFSATS